MTRLRWHPAARRELIEAADFYDSRSPGLGAAFVDRVDLVLDRLRRYPSSGTPDPSIRRAGVRGFPYSVIYRLEHEDLLVLAIAHQKRRPGYWMGR